MHYFQGFDYMGKETQDTLNDDKKLRKMLNEIKAQQKIKWKYPTARKQANSLWDFCFRNTEIENYHGDDYISDNEMKNVSIETCARIEYLIKKNRFFNMSAKEIFAFTFETAYKKYVKKTLPKSKWTVLRKQIIGGLANTLLMKKERPLLYETVTTIKPVSSYYDGDIKFDGKKLTSDPDSVKVGHQYLTR
jgi:hypothetical protein